MWRYFAGAASAVLLIAAGFFLVKSMAEPPLVPSAPASSSAEAPASAPSTGDPLATPMRFADKAGPPTATELSKEEKRFNRYDKDKNGGINKSEYLNLRQKSYAKLDVNGDGVLSFDEYTVKARAKFAKADGDRSGVLNRSEFSTTRAVRKTKPMPKCPPQQRKVPAQSAAPDDDEAET